MTARRKLLAAALGVAAALASVHVPRTLRMVYPDILGCETGCAVVAGGLPFAYAADYPGLSVGQEVSWFGITDGADRLLWSPFAASVAAWVLLALAVAAPVSRRR